MQGELSRTGAPVAVGASARTGAISTQWAELWRGGWVIFVKHMRKFASNSMEIGGTLGWPILWVVMFGLGMERMVDTGNLGGAGSYLAFITPGIIALTALSGAVNAGMVLLEEKTKGVLKEYFVAPIPRMSILLASTGSGLVKTLIQTAIILILAVVLGARITGGFWGLWGAAIFLLLYVMAFVGFSNGMAARSKSVGATAGSTTYTISNAGSGTLTWSADVFSGGDWIAVSAKADGTGNGTITVQYDENAGESARLAIVRISAPGAAGSPIDVNLIQSAKEQIAEDLNGDDAINAVDVQIIVNAALGFGGNNRVLVYQ